MNNTENKYALIVAGGSGVRMGASIPKQFLLLNNRPVLMNTLDVFYNFDSSLNIILVLPSDQIENWKLLMGQYNFHVPHRLISGGQNRFESVKQGLTLINEDGLVAIHDGVRPLVTSKIIQDGFEAAAKNGSAIAAIGLRDSIREKDEKGTKVRNRENYYLIQTPQTFRVDVIKKAYAMAQGKDFTDDASVVEAAGLEVHLIEGSSINFKITTPEDLQLANALLQSQ